MATKQTDLKRVTQAALQIAGQIASQATAEPADDETPVVTAIEQALAMLEKRAAPGSDLAALVDASRAAIGKNREGKKE